MNNFIIIRDIVLFLLYTFTSIFALIGNGIVFRVTLRHQHHLLSQSTIHFPLSTTRMLLFNLALADTLLGLTIPIQFIFCSKYFLENFSFSSYLCVLNKFMQILGYNVSTLTVCLIAYDRFRLIQNPLVKYYERKLSHALLSIWILSSLFSASCLVSTKVQTYFTSTENFFDCQILLPTIAKHFSNDYIVKTRMFCVVISFYIIPLLSITILSILTVRIISRRSVIGVQRFRKFVQTRTRSSNLLLITMVLFVLSRTPIHFIHLRDFLMIALKSSSSRSIRVNKCNNSTMYLLFYWLSISSCCYNPIIYSWFNRRFRFQIFHCCRLIFYCGRY